MYTKLYLYNYHTLFHINAAIKYEPSFMKHLPFAYDVKQIPYLQYTFQWPIDIIKYSMLYFGKATVQWGGNGLLDKASLENLKRERFTALPLSFPLPLNTKYPFQTPAYINK